MIKKRLFLKPRVKNLPVFMHDSTIRNFLIEAIKSIPKRTRVYIIGGAARNAVYFRLFHRKLPARDIDLLVKGDFRQFIRNLLSHGFIYGKTRRKNEVVLKKKGPDSNQHLFLDIYRSDKKSITKNLEKYANFTINGFALALQNSDRSSWYNHVIHLRRARSDLKKRRIRINSLNHPASLFACIRFMSRGFKAPSKEEVQMLLKALKKIEKRRYQRNLNKLFRYVGGQNKARKLLKKVGIKEDIFNFKVVKQLI